jgi:hypothetical protein
MKGEVPDFPISSPLLFARTGLGRAFRATSDDRAVAQKMGINNRHLYAVATALAFGVTAIAGVFLAVRTTFIPTLSGRHRPDVEPAGGIRRSDLSGSARLHPHRWLRPADPVAERRNFAVPQTATG